MGGTILMLTLALAGDLQHATRVHAWVYDFSSGRGRKRTSVHSSAATNSATALAASLHRAFHPTSANVPSRSAKSSQAAKSAWFA
jgi:hypothetical protein